MQKMWNDTAIHRRTSTEMWQRLTCTMFLLVFFRYFLAMMCLRSSLNLSVVFYVIQMSRGKAKECNSIARVVYQLGDGYWLFKLWKLTPKQPINQSHRNDLRIDSVFVHFNTLCSVGSLHTSLSSNDERMKKIKTTATLSHSFPQEKHSHSKGMRTIKWHGKG